MVWYETTLGRHSLLPLWTGAQCSAPGLAVTPCCPLWTGPQCSAPGLALGHSLLPL